MLPYLEHTNCRGLQLFLVDNYMWLCDWLHYIEHWSCMDHHMHKG